MAKIGLKYGINAAKPISHLQLFLLPVFLAFDAAMLEIRASFPAHLSDGVVP